MNHSFLFAALAAALLSPAIVAQASAPSSSAAPPASAAPLHNPIPSPPEDDANVEEVLTAMNNSSTWGHPDLFGEFAGMRLYANGKYAAAIKYFKYGARYADKLSQLSIGLMYANGQGVDKDPVKACAWLALASERKFPQFVATRNRVCMALTPAQHDAAVAELDKLMPEYGDAVAKQRMVRALDFAKMETTGSHLGFDSGITTVGVKSNCGGKVIAGTTMAGCGSNDFWSPQRWDPKQYFAARDAGWRATVTVGALQDMNAVHDAAKRADAGKAAPAPSAPASSAGH